MVPKKRSSQKNVTSHMITHEERHQSIKDTFRVTKKKAYNLNKFIVKIGLENVFRFFILFPICVFF